MKKLYTLFLIILGLQSAMAQELLANVQVNYAQLGGSNVQVYKTLEKSLQEFINNTSWTGKNIQNFEKIKCNFSIIINSREGNSAFNASIIVQAVRPVYGSTYETPLLNVNDTSFSFDYSENENLIFNERQFSGKNLIDVISFYVYLILGYDADSFSLNGGQKNFDIARKISQNSQNQKYGGWAITDGQRSRGNLIDNLMKTENNVLRNTYYSYHRKGLDLLSDPGQASAKSFISEALMNLKYYESNFQMNYPFNLFIEAKKNEIFELFNTSEPAGGVKMPELKNLMLLYSPRDADSKWNKWK